MDVALNETRFHPYRRHDQYGCMGLKPQSPFEMARLVVCAILLLPLRVVGCLLAIFSCWSVCRLAFLLPQEQRIQLVSAWGKGCARVCLWCAGFITIKYIKLGPEGKRGGLMPKGGGTPPTIISNHVGWADILVHMALYFPSFVAKSSVRNVPLVGAIWCAVVCAWLDQRQISMGVLTGMTSQRSESMQCLWVERGRQEGPTQVGTGRPKMGHCHDT